MTALRRIWSRLTLSGQITLLLASTVIVIECVTIVLEYRVLHARALDQGRATATDFALTLYPALSVVADANRETVEAMIEGPTRSIAYATEPPSGVVALEDHALRIRETLRAAGHDVAEVVVLEQVYTAPAGEAEGAGLEVHVAMRPSGAPDWIVASTLAIPRPATLPLLLTASVESLAALLVLAAILVVLRRLFGPLGRLTESAARIAHGEPVDPLPVEGSADMRETIKTFNQMSESITQTVAYQRSLLQSLGHDLKTPLATARALVDEATGPPEQERIGESLDRVENILRSITDFTRATLRDGEVEPVDLSSLLEALVEEAEERGHVMSHDLAQGVTVPARYYALGRALRNLIENAGIHGGTAHVTLTPSAETAVIWIDDAGDGIDEAMLETVFEPFSRLSDDPRGSGLGLAISRTIIVDHGGTLTLANRPTGGLRQTICLPL